MQFNDVVKNWLSNRKVTENVQKLFNITSNELGQIVFPVYDIDGKFLFNKYRRSPLSEEGSKYLYDKGSRVSLFGIDKAHKHDSILITEGEADCLVAWSHNIPAVSSTGGAQSFQKEWVPYFVGKEVIICYDNDPAGAEGVIKTLEILPSAKVLLLPTMPRVKDISDYVSFGGDLIELLKTAKHYDSIIDVSEDRAQKVALYQNTYFHDAYIKAHTKKENTEVKKERRTYSSDAVTNAKQYPITNLLEFTRNKAICPFHNEDTPSLHYYEKTNTCYCFGQCGKSFDAIAIYMKINNCSFTEAVSELNKKI